MGKATLILLTKYREKMSFNFGYICLVSKHQSNQIVNMKKNTFIALLIFLSVIGCQKQVKNEEVETNDTIVKSDNSQNSLDYLGIYKGVLPCADCEGIATTLELKENATYSLKTSYQGKSTKVFEQKGTFKWNDNGNTIELSDIDNGPNNYFVGENTLTQLDMSNSIIEGDLATAYILKKEIATSEIAKTIEENPSTEKLNNRMITKTVIKTVNPAEGKFALAKTHWRLIELNGKKIKQKGKKDFFIQLNSSDGRFHGYAGCNNFNGNYAMPKSFEISFSNIISTMMACPNMDLESILMKTLQEVNQYTIKGKILELKKAKMTPLAKFEAVK